MRRSPCRRPSAIRAERVGPRCTFAQQGKLAGSLLATRLECGPGNLGEAPCGQRRSTTFRAEWSRRAYLDEAGYQAKYDGLDQPIPTRSGASRASASTGSSRSPRSRTPASVPATSRSNGSRTASPTSPTTASTGISTTRGDQVAIIWEGDDPDESTARSPTASCTTQVCRFANVLQEARRQEGRPRHDLHADDPRGGLRDARLRAHRRDPFRGVRRLLAGSLWPSRIDGLRNRASSSPPTRACAAAARCRSRPMSTRAISSAGRAASMTTCWSCAAPARRSTWCRAATSDYDEAARR